MGQYIPDLTERFPEGFGGVDLTDRYFPPSHYDPMLDYDLLERSEQLDVEDELPFEDEEPRQFDIDKSYIKYGFYGGVTYYVVEKIDRPNHKILMGELWEDVDGSGRRPSKWHPLEIDEHGNERAFLWESQEFGKVYVDA